MATTYDAQAGAGDYDVAGGGWITFAALMLGLAGTFNVIDGIVALSKSSFFTTNATYVFSNLHTWGWIVLILGILQRASSLPPQSVKAATSWRIPRISTIQPHVCRLLNT